MEGNSYVGATARGLTKEVDIPTPWGKIAAKTYGDFTNPPVLCIHGWLDNANSFDKLLPYLPKDFFYVFMDLPGHGLSSHIPLGLEYSQSVYVTAVLHLVKYFKWSHFHIISHSMGGDIASMFAAAFPKMVDKIVLIDATAVWVYLGGGNPANVFRRNVNGIIEHENTLHKKKQKYTHEEAKKRAISGGTTTEETTETLFERGFKRHEDGLYSIRRDLRTKFWSHTWDEPSPSHNTKEFLINVKADILYIIGKKGFIAKYFGLQWLKMTCTETLSQAKIHDFVTVDGDHHVHIGNAETVAKHIGLFLCKISSSKL
uniref:Serine hydrolase-like protein n=1 Tax=Phallusia mammillata TaxID=59560 RepID=A0A6F9DRB2_9ASCI|nr:serine hydrolase-like protein [Phallusia mammillata]